MGRRTILSGVGVTGLSFLGLGTLPGLARGHEDDHEREDDHEHENEHEHNHEHDDGHNHDDDGDDGDDHDLPNTVTIKACTDVLSYNLSVSGRIEKGPNACKSDEFVDENTVHGHLDNDGGIDDYRFSGTITSFELLEGEATVSVNGEQVEDPVGLPSDAAQDEREADEPSAGAFALEQGDECVPLTPLSFQDQTVTEFYGYEPDADAPNARQSNTPTNLERAGVSRLFLFEGPEGLSLVIIHGGGPGERGGAVSFEFTGLPEDGEFVVVDDSHPGTEDVIEVEGTQAVIHWAWGIGTRSDGAAFRGLEGEDVELRIQPAFNEEAMREPLGPGEIEQWQVLSGSATDPEVTNLSLDESVTIRTGTCD